MKANYLVRFLVHSTFALTPLFLSGFSALAQGRKTSCNCPANDFTETTAVRNFPFSNGKTIVLCGYEEPSDGKTGVTFSEFVLAVCGQKKVINFWDATKTCQIRASRDTLMVEELETFASTKTNRFTPAVWAVEKLYFANGQLQRRRMPNRQLARLYDVATVRQVVQAYEKTSSGTDEYKSFLAARLFVATLTGDTKARAYFLNFEKKFSFAGGESAEAYTAMRRQLAFWDKP